jgi:siroheme synthase
MTTRGRKAKPGRITFVGSGPGDPGLLTTRARAVLANVALVEAAYRSARSRQIVTYDTQCATSQKGGTD